MNGASSFATILPGIQNSRLADGLGELKSPPQNLIFCTAATFSHIVRVKRLSIKEVIWSPCFCFCEENRIDGCQGCFSAHEFRAVCRAAFRRHKK